MAIDRECTIDESTILYLAAIVLVLKDLHHSLAVKVGLRLLLLRRLFFLFLAIGVT